jgi:hypothetical protein
MRKQNEKRGIPREEGRKRRKEGGLAYLRIAQLVRLHLRTDGGAVVSTELYVEGAREGGREELVRL